jgi:hypothetical protein
MASKRTFADNVDDDDVFDSQAQTAAAQKAQSDLNRDSAKEEKDEKKDTDDSDILLCNPEMKLVEWEDHAKNHCNGTTTASSSRKCFNRACRSGKSNKNDITVTRSMYMEFYPVVFDKKKFQKYGAPLSKMDNQKKYDKFLNEDELDTNLCLRHKYIKDKVVHRGLPYRFAMELQRENAGLMTETEWRNMMTGFISDWKEMLDNYSNQDEQEDWSVIANGINTKMSELDEYLGRLDTVQDEAVLNAIENFKREAKKTLKRKRVSKKVTPLLNGILEQIENDAKRAKSFVDGEKEPVFDRR